MKKVFRESFIGHELCNKQSLFSLTAAPNQVSQSFIPQLPHSTCLLLKGPTKKDTKIRHKNSTHTTRSKKKQKPEAEAAARTRNCRESGQADLLKRFTATVLSSSSLPL
ncbi:hypothetical protein V8G54_025259 [Vigna mungo]|uniref:Uncharacterized protein n=1 Tax=Vigna mungo TaxID=3915 RepID=A0AAQ3N964_VIGMU